MLTLIHIYVRNSVDLKKNSNDFLKSTSYGKERFFVVVRSEANVQR